MKQITDDFLLMSAQVAATLIGLVAVGMFYYLDTGLRRLTVTREFAEPVIRSMSKQIFLLFSIVLALSVSLLALSEGWQKGAFLVLGFFLAVSSIQFTYRIVKQRELYGKVPAGWSLVPMWGWIILILGLPWSLGGWHPTRNDFSWSLLLSGLLGFMNLIGLLLLSFDIARQEEDLRAAQDAATRRDQPSG